MIERAVFHVSVEEMLCILTGMAARLMRQREEPGVSTAVILCLVYRIAEC